MLDLAKFLLFVFVFVFLPGRLLFSTIKTKFSPFETFLISTALGIVILTLLSYVLGYLRLDFLLVPLLILAGLYLFLRQGWRPKWVPIPSKLALLAILIGTIFQTILMVKSGTSYQGGLAFWGIHGYDSIWHASLIQELVNHFPPQNPGFAGEALKNYHFLTDLLLAQIHKITGISILDLYFRYCPVLFSFLLNGLIYIFVRRWSRSEQTALWAIFFASIAGSFGFVPPFFGLGSNNWETAFWGIQPTTAFLNPPFGLSLVILMLGLVFLDVYLKEKSRNLVFILALIFGILIGFKVYAGIIALGGLGVLGGLRVLREKDFGVLVVFLISTTISAFLFLPVNSGSTNYIVWQPWWFIKTMIEAPDRLNWPALEIRRQVYALYGNWRNLFLLGILGFLFFLLGNLGMRFIGFISLVKRSRRIENTDLFLLFLLILAFFPPIFFTQKVVPWNSIQFLYYFTFLFSLFAAESVTIFASKLKYKVLKIILGIFLVSLALPSTLKTVYWFIVPTPTTLLEARELEGLEYLKEISNKEDVILTYELNKLSPQNFNTYPIPMTYYNSPYVSFLTGRRMYLEDLNSATLLSYDIDSRLKAEKEFFNGLEVNAGRNFLSENKIRYLYLVNDQGMNLNYEGLGLNKIFDKDNVRIYSVNGTI